MAGCKTGNAQGQAIPIKNFGKALTNHRPNPPAHQGLGGMLAAGTTAKIAVDHKDTSPLMRLQIKGVPPLELSAIIRKSLDAQPLKGDALQKAGRNNPIRINIIAG
jgi:hypothetical protein